MCSDINTLKATFPDFFIKDAMKKLKCLSVFAGNIGQILDAINDILTVLSLLCSVFHGRLRGYIHVRPDSGFVKFFIHKNPQKLCKIR